MDANFNAKPLDDLTFEDVIEGDIFELAGIKVSDEERDELMNGFINIIRIRIIDRIDQELQDSQRETLKKILDGGTKEELSSFVGGLGLDLEAISAEEAAKVKVEFLTYVNLVRESGDNLAEFLSKIKNSEI